MLIHDSEYDLDLIPEPAKPGLDSSKPRDAYQIRRMIERHAEIKQLRDLLGDPDFNDLD